jgi:hypothetical protein
MASRLDLQAKLEKILGSGNVYFQPPARMNYPCIKYSLSGIATKRADNAIYNSINRYEVIVIDYDPDSTIHTKILESFRMCSFDRAYKANNLNHFVLTLYF